MTGANRQRGKAGAEEEPDYKEITKQKMEDLSSYRAVSWRLTWGHFIEEKGDYRLASSVFSQEVCGQMKHKNKDHYFFGFLFVCPVTRRTD